MLGKAMIMAVHIPDVDGSWRIEEDSTELREIALPHIS